MTENTTPLCSEAAVQQIGNIFETVLILSQRMRELKAGHASLVPAKTMLTSAFSEIEQGKVGKAYLYKEPPRYPKREYRK